MTSSSGSSHTMREYTQNEGGVWLPWSKQRAMQLLMSSQHAALDLCMSEPATCVLSQRRVFCYGSMDILTIACCLSSG